jgi:hypothetical protein
MQNRRRAKDPAPATNNEELPMTVGESDLDREVMPWQPKKGDKLIGRVLSVEEMDSPHSGDTYPYLEVETDDGKLCSWHAAQTVAKSAVRRKRVREGDQIAVKYLGEHAKGYKDFRIVVEHAGQEPESFPVDEPPEGESW